VAALLVSTGLAAPVASAESSARTRPSALWRAFPLRVDPPASVATPAARGLVPPVRTATPPVIVIRTPESSGNGRLFAGALVVLLVAGAGAAFLVLRGPARRWDRAATAAVSRGRAGGLAGLLRGSRAVEPSYVLLLPGRGGWGDRLVERLGPTPSLGEVIYDDDLGRVGQAYVVKLVRRSPLPGDKRSCAVLRSL
jgi:hypothetical protein